MALVNLKIEDANPPLIYSNFASVSALDDEVQIDFCFASGYEVNQALKSSDESDDLIEVKGLAIARVAMTKSNAKKLLEALNFIIDQRLSVQDEMNSEPEWVEEL